MKKFLIAVAVVLGLASGVLAQGKDTTDFIRFKDGNTADSGLQIAVTEFVSDVQTQTTVTLYGVVHIADGEYYKKVQTDLDTYDAVLYEGVGGDKAKMANIKKETSPLSAIQHLAGDILDLQFQLDSIDYTRKNLVHADVASMDELKGKMKGESISPLGQYVKDDQLAFLKPILDTAGPLIKQLMKTQPEWQNKIKAQLAQELSKADVSTQLSPTMFKAIVLDRNQIVIDTLNEQFTSCPNKHTYAIFYGAAHMPDLEARLNKLGFKEKSKRWQTAWSVKPVEADEEDGNEAPKRLPQGRQDDRQKKIEEDEDK